MSKDEIHVGDNYTEWVLTMYRSDTETALDISGATGGSDKIVYFKNVDSGSLTTYTASFVVSGTDGSIVVTTTSATFSTEGAYQLQAVVKLGSALFNSDVYGFDVYKNIY